MKAILVNIGVFLAIIGAYYIDFFGWFTSKYAMPAAIAFVIIIFLAALKVLGNPFAKEDDHDDK